MSEEKVQNMDQILLEALTENRDQIKQAVTKSLIDRIVSQYRYDIPQVIQTEVDNFIKDEILPEVRKSLLNNKDAIVQGATEVALSIGTGVAKAVQEQIAKNMTNSWKLEKMVKELVGS